MATIKIIDDDRESAENLALLLRKEGHAVEVRTAVEGAVDDLLRDTPDLLILDVMFPENPAAGFETARQIRQNSALKALPIVLLTAVNQEYPLDFSAQDIDPAWMPVQDFVDKTAPASVVLGRIRRWLKGAPRNA